MDKLDLRTKIGLVVVSASTISELRYPKAAPPGVGFFTSRMMLAEGESLETLEDEIGKPVVTSHSATPWSVLSQAGVTEPVYGYGRLLAEPRIDLRKNATSVG